MKLCEPERRLTARALMVESAVEVMMEGEEGVDDGDQERRKVWW
jgi:hypothetical protein